ncbi:MAG: hypothetical protein LC799_34070 [Actinobacteria bacterium]|nr:hypothetical protein [Actinomycetota bacterium]
MSALTAARVIEVTNDAGCSHLVAEDRFTTGCRTGRFIALCGDEVLTASLATAERERCSKCVRKAGNRGRD